jgi:hypothetical protein
MRCGIENRKRLEDRRGNPHRYTTASIPNSEPSALASRGCRSGSQTSQIILFKLNVNQESSAIAGQVTICAANFETRGERLLMLRFVLDFGPQPERLDQFYNQVFIISPSGCRTGSVSESLIAFPRLRVWLLFKKTARGERDRASR